MNPYFPERLAKFTCRQPLPYHGNCLINPTIFCLAKQGYQNLLNKDLNRQHSMPKSKGHNLSWEAANVGDNKTFFRQNWCWFNIALAYMAGRFKNNQRHIATQLRFRLTNNAEQ